MGCVSVRVGGCVSGWMSQRVRFGSLCDDDSPSVVKPWVPAENFQHFFLWLIALYRIRFRIRGRDRRSHQHAEHSCSNLTFVDFQLTLAHCLESQLQMVLLE